MGSKKRPFYRIVVIDSRKARSARYIEKLGHFDPFSNDDDIRLVINREGALNWLDKGAIPTKVVKDIFSREKIWEEFTKNKLKKQLEKDKKKKKHRKKKSHPVSEIKKRREERNKKATFKKNLAEAKKVKALEKESPKNSQSPPESKTKQVETK